jgi:hypothetical protein
LTFDTPDGSGEPSRAVIAMMSDLIDHLPAALSSTSLIVIIVAVSPRILDRVPKIIEACAFLLLVRALVKRLGREPKDLAGLTALIRDLRAPSIAWAPEDAASEQELGDPLLPPGR